MRFDNAGFLNVVTVSFSFDFNIIVIINMLQQSSFLKPLLTIFYITQFTRFLKMSDVDIIPLLFTL